MPIWSQFLATVLGVRGFDPIAPRFVVERWHRHIPLVLDAANVIGACAELASAGRGASRFRILARATGAPFSRNGAYVPPLSLPDISFIPRALLEFEAARLLSTTRRRSIPTIDLYHTTIAGPSPTGQHTPGNRIGRAR
jgi:hypothetical protein